jgi:hypothetical protein
MRSPMNDVLFIILVTIDNCLDETVKKDQGLFLHVGTNINIQFGDI